MRPVLGRCSGSGRGHGGGGGVHPGARRLVGLRSRRVAEEKLAAESRLAALGVLTSGIAHEINNPLNFINNFAELSVELAQELSDEMSRRKDQLVGNDGASIFDLVAAPTERLSTEFLVTLPYKRS